MKFKYILFSLLILFSVNAFATDTSYLGISLNISDSIIDSTSPVLFDSFTFNTTENQTFIGILSSFNMDKELGTTTSDVGIVFEIDGLIIFNDYIRTVSKNRPGVSGVPPLLFNVSSGEHTFNSYAYRTGTGAVSLYNNQISFGQFVSLEGGVGRGNLTFINSNFSSTNFTTILTKNITKNVNTSTYIAGTFYFDSLSTTNVSCIFVNGGNSPIMIVSLIGSGQTKSFSTNYVTEPESFNETLSLKCSSSDGVNVNIEGSFIEADMKDNSGNPINHYFMSNPSTNFTNYVDISAQRTDYLVENVTILAGTNLLISKSISFRSLSGDNLATFYINVSDNLGNSVCYFEKERFSSGDIGNVFNYPVCEGLSVGSNYTIYSGIILNAGESIRIYDESLSYFENSYFNVSIKNVPPLVCGDNSVSLYGDQIPYYAEVGSNSLVSFYLTNSEGALLNDSDINLFVTFDNFTFYETSYSNNRFNINITSSIEEDSTLFIRTTSSNYSCVYDSIDVKFRVPFYATVKVYKFDNETEGVEPYINDFNYIYMKYLPETDSGLADYIPSQSSISRFFSQTYSWIPGIDMLYDDDFESTIVHWGAYNEGQAIIKLYEPGMYKIFLLTQSEKGLDWNYEFYKPQQFDIRVDSGLVKVNLSNGEDVTLELLTDDWEIDKIGYVFNWVKLFIYFILIVISLGMIAVLPGGTKVVGAIAPILLGLVFKLLGLI